MGKEGKGRFRGRRLVAPDVAQRLDDARLVRRERPLEPVVSSGPGVFAANGTNPTAAPTVTDAPTTTNAPTRTETYAPTRMTEAPSYAPTTDTYAPTMAPTTTEAPTGMPTANMTNTTTRRRLEATVPLPVSKSFHRSGGAHTEARRRLQALSS